ncbi:MAG: tyrosine-type recombinase/integrase [Solirubrobacterales bacterium]|nr:tyrosine-type recombinase/integrase [Solirubrobacterales bacterium]
MLSGMCTLAARHDALERNPARGLGPVSTKPKKAPRAMTVPELRQLRAALTYDEQALGRDLPDLVSFMMATGLRIGETTGLAWDAVDLAQGTVDVRAAAIRVKGHGLVIKTTKTDAGTRTLVLPQWCVTMLRRRASAIAPSAGDTNGRPVFPAPLGGWRDPSNTQADLREAFANAGFDWVSSNVFRKTVAGPGRPLLPSGRRPTRPRQHLHDQRRVLRPQGSGHRRGRRVEVLGT